MRHLLEVAKARLSTRRFAHVEGVVITAQQLADRYHLDPEKAGIAAVLHDIDREQKASALKVLADELGVLLSDENEATWHGPVTAARLARDFHIDDDEIAKAVAWHTVGHPEMGLLAQVIYVADAIEPGRNFIDVESLRLAATMDLQLAVAVTADASIMYLIGKQDSIAMSTVALRNKMWRLVDEKLKNDYNQRSR